MATNGSARLTRSYTDAQRRAVLEAHLIDGLSMAETERQAIAGTLRPDIGPFGRPRFVYSVIAKGREQYEASNAQALDSGATGELERLTRLALARARELDKTADPAEIARRAKALAETHKALRGSTQSSKAAKPKASNREPQTETTAQSQPDTLAQLVGLANTPSTQRDAA